MGLLMGTSGKKFCKKINTEMAEAIANYEWLVHTGPKEDVEYPLKIVYCEVADNWPLEYCEHHPNYEKAKLWMEDNLDDALAAMFLGERGDDKSEGGEEKKRQKRGGKGQIKTKKERRCSREYVYPVHHEA